MLWEMRINKKVFGVTVIGFFNYVDVAILSLFLLFYCFTMYSCLSEKSNKNVSGWAEKKIENMSVNVLSDDNTILRMILSGIFEYSIFSGAAGLAVLGSLFRVYLELSPQICS